DWHGRAARRCAAAVEHGGQRHHRDAAASGSDRAVGIRKPRACRAKGPPLRGDIVCRRRSIDRDVDHRNAGRSGPPGDRRQFRPACAGHPQKRAADRPDGDGSRHARHDRDRIGGGLPPGAAVAADPARDRLCGSTRWSPGRSAAAGETVSSGPVARPARTIAAVKAGHYPAVYPTIRSRPTQKPAFSTFLSTLPTEVIGSSLTNFTCFGACAEPLRALTRLISSSAFGRTPSRATTTAVTASPHLLSDTPTTATIATSACCARTSWSSRGKILKPPETIMSFLRSRMNM